MTNKTKTGYGNCMRTHKATKAELESFAASRVLNPSSAGGALDGPSNYIGPSEFDRIIVISRTRDSDNYELSNFDVALDLLGGEGEGEGVEIIRFGHWACGYVEHLALDPTDTAKLQIAYDIHHSLKSYPLLDEDYYYELESDVISESAECSYEQDAALKQILSLTDVPEATLLADDGYLLRLLTHDLISETDAYSGDKSVGDTLARVLKAGYSCIGSDTLDELCVSYGAAARHNR